MKNALLLTLLAAVVGCSSAASADSLNFTNNFGTATVGYFGIWSHGMQLTSYNGIHAAKGHSLGSVYFQTGAMMTGTVLGSGTFTDVGSRFIITGTSKGVPHGTIFFGMFVGPVDWTLLSHHGESYSFTLSGTIYGALWNGRMATGHTVQYISLFKNQWAVDHHGLIGIGGGNLSTPEPNTLLLLSAGALPLVGMFRRKVIA